MRVAKSIRACLWAVAILTLAEGGVRVRAWYRHGNSRPEADLYELDETGRRQLRAGANLAGSERKVRINRLGFRGSELAVPKPPGVLRIVALGDSTTFGMEAADDESVWVSRVGTQLQSYGQRIETVNAAVPGYTLADSIAVLDIRTEELQPDIVLVHQVATDIAAHARRQFGANAKQSASASSLAAFFERNSLLLNLVKANSTALTARWLSPRRHDALDERGVEEYAQRLTDLVRECQARGVRTVLCTAPRSFGDPAAWTNQFELAASTLAQNPALSLAGLNDAFDRYNAAIREVALATNTALIDLDRAVPKRPDYFVDAIHLNNAGHEFVGQLVAGELSTLLDSAALVRSAP